MRASLGKSSAREASALRRSLQRAVLVFAVTAGAWLALAPLYDRLIFTAANAVLGLADPPIATIAQDGDGFQVLRLQGPARLPAFTFDRYGTFFNLIFLIALLAATPGLRSRARLGRLVLGVLALAGVHVLFVVIEVQAQFVNAGWTYATPRAAYALNWAAVLLGPVGEKLFPLLLAAALSGRAWLRALGSSRPRAPRRRVRHHRTVG